MLNGKTVKLCRMILNVKASDVAQHMGMTQQNMAVYESKNVLPREAERKVRKALVELGLSESIIDECQSITELWLVEKRREANKKGGVNHG